MIVYENIDLPGTGAPRGLVEIELWGAGRPTIGRNVSDGSLIAGRKQIVTDDAGQWSADLVPNTDITPENTTYRCRRFIDCEVFTSYLNVPASGGPYEAFTIGEDAMNEIPASALAAHSADLALHGGGIEVDYSEMASNMTVTGSAAVLGAVTPLAVTVPDLDRPVYVFFDLHMLTPTGSGDSIAGIGPWDGVSPTVGVFSLLGGVYGEGVDSDSIPTHYFGAVRIASHTPGLYLPIARREASPWSMTVVASTLVKAKCWAVTA
jgi:hypothetical protein